MRVGVISIPPNYLAVNDGLKAQLYSNDFGQQQLILVHDRTIPEGMRATGTFYMLYEIT